MLWGSAGLVSRSSLIYHILKSHLPSFHTYAGDTQLYHISFNPNEAQAVAAIKNCIYDVSAWMWNNKLMLNEEKTEFLIIGTERQLSKVSVDKIKVGQAEVTPVSSACNLGAWFDSHLDMSTHVTKLAVALFIICIIYGILESICLVNLLKDLFTRLLQVGWIIVIVYYMVVRSFKLRNFKQL